MKAEQVRAQVLAEVDAAAAKGEVGGRRLDWEAIRADVLEEPLRRAFDTQWQGRAEYWLVYSESKYRDDGYKIVYDETLDAYGLAVVGKDGEYHVMGFHSRSLVDVLLDL